MSEQVNDGKRGFLKTAMLGAGASAIGAAAPGPVLAQMLETSISESSVLAKIRKEGVINVGYAQTGPWFYKDAKTGELGGIYKDVVDMLAKEIQIKVEWKEVTFANSTVALRRGDYDLSGSSLVYLVQRALAKRADAWISGDSDVILFAKRNESWAVALDPMNPLDRRPNTWLIRYGDAEWKQFLDFWCTYLVVNGEIERLFKHHMEKLGAA